MTGPLAAGRGATDNGSRKEATNVNANGVSIARAPFGVARTDADGGETVEGGSEGEERGFAWPFWGWLDLDLKQVIISPMYITPFEFEN